MYIDNFGADYKPEPYIVRDYERAKNHKYYMTSRMICVNDIYSFDPNAKVDLNDFVDIIGRNFRQPEEGLGFDNTPSAHMWRTLMWPTRFLSESLGWWGESGGENSRRPAVRLPRSTGRIPISAARCRGPIWRGSPRAAVNMSAT